MTLWRLQPVDALSRCWEASTYQGMVIVRARDEQAARSAAEKAFGTKTRFSPGTGTKAPPWRRPEFVTAEVIEDPRYDSEGPTEILYPPQPEKTA